MRPGDLKTVPSPRVKPLRTDRSACPEAASPVSGRLPVRRVLQTGGARLPIAGTMGKVSRAGPVRR
jgi:hypothetical protein